MRALVVSVLVLMVGCSAPSAPSTTSSLSPHPTPRPAPVVGGVVEYPVGTPGVSLSGMTAGPDGNLWFVDVANGAYKVGRATPSGAITEFDVPGAVGGPQAITAGPDGNVWMAASAGGVGNPSWILSISPAGAIRQFAIPGVASDGKTPGPDGITTGPDGSIWFTEFFRDAIGRITTAGVITEYPIGTGSGGPRGIVAGPDGNLWFTETALNHGASGGQIARMTPGGNVIEYPLGGSSTDQRNPTAIVVGPDRNLWFTEAGGGRIGRITTAGQLTEFPLQAPGQAQGLTVGPDGNLWFADWGGNAIGRISTTGVIRRFALPRPNSQPLGIATGSDGRIWFTEAGANRVGSIGETVPEIALRSRVVSFGIGSAPTSQPLTITNTGDARLSFASVKIVGATPAAFTLVHDTCSDRSVAVGATCQVEVAFAPNPGSGVMAARLELTDNATGSPQIVSLVGQLPDCRLPVVTRSQAPVKADGGFLNLRTGAVEPDPSGVFVSDQGSGLYRSAAAPTLSGTSPAYYDLVVQRWLPTNAASVSPDHARYAYSDNSGGMNGVLHVVDIATGRDRPVNLPAGFWGVIGFGRDGIYVHQSYEGIGPGLTLVDPDSGAVRSVFADDVVFQVSDGVAWVGARNQQDPVSPPQSMGATYNEVVSRDLATSAKVPWFYLSGANVYVWAAGGGRLLVSAYDQQGPQTWLVNGPNQAVHLTAPGTADDFSFSNGFISDARGVWLGGLDGVYLWTSATGLTLVSDVVATPAGSCQ